MHRGKLERQAARVAVIGQQQVQRRRRLQHGEVTAAIRDGRIAQFQSQAQPVFHAGRLLCGAWKLQRAGDLIGYRLRPLHPPAQIEEQPTTAAHHVLRREPGECRRERQDARHRLVSRIQRLAVPRVAMMAEGCLPPHAGRVTVTACISPVTWSRSRPVMRGDLAEQGVD